MLNRFYQKQQLIMTMLGYYDGVCDGVWGPKCVQAKAQWELEDDFEPAIPSNGLPFTGRGKLPKGMHYSYKGLDIIWDKWDQAKADEILASEKGQMLTRQHVHDHVMQAQEKAEDVSVPEIQARGQQQSQPEVSTLKPFEQQPAAEAEAETEQIEEDSDAIGDENLDDDKASEGEDATSNQSEKKDWLQKRRK